MTLYYSLEAAFHGYKSTDPARLAKYLGPEEGQIFQTLRFPKRQRDWLAGRLSVKRLVQAADAQLKAVNLQDIQILKAPSGAPLLQLMSDIPPSGTISLSHSNGNVFCAYEREPARHLGIDLELIEARDPSFLDDYFNQNEIQQILAHPLGQHFAATLFWSVKEALLKALSLGLRIDTRRIELSLPANTPSDQTWQSISYKINTEKLPPLHLFWRKEGSFVLTICTQASQPEEFRCL